MPNCEVRRYRPCLLVVVASLVLAAGACRDRQGPSASAPPPVSVLVETVAAQSIPRVVELPGRIEAIRSAEVRARVDGIVERRLYEEGTDVPAGAPLFLIDSRDYEAALQQAQAALSRAQAVQGNAASEVARFKPLVERLVVSAQEYEAALAALQQAEANVADARAAVTLARLRLDRCTVRAPIAGRVGRALVTEGALVSASGATLLTQVNQLTPVNAVFTQSNLSLLELRKQFQSGAISAPTGRVQVWLTLANGDEYKEPGVLDFTDLVVEPSTGTQILRARFDNVSRVLLPGQFVRGRIEIGTIPNGILVPARAVQFGNNATSLSIVADDGTVVRRNVDLGPQEAGQWVVKDGLEAGERVIVDGWQKVQPGQHVDAQPMPASHS